MFAQQRQDFLEFPFDRVQGRVTVRGTLDKGQRILFLLRRMPFFGSHAILQNLARAGDGVALTVEQAFDFEDGFDVLSPVLALAVGSLLGSERGKLALPETQNIRLDSGKLRNVADSEEQAVWDFWSRWLRLFGNFLRQLLSHC
jgi:hypothetical protein